MRILLIEDNPGDVRLVQEILKEAPGNFTLNVAERLGAGLKFLLSNNIDVVLLDMNLPDSGGLETLTRMQAEFPHMPVVIMTSIADESLAVQAVHLGAQDYLVKGETDVRLLWRSLVYAVERKLIDEALRQSEERLRFALESCNAGAWDMDLADHTTIRSLEHDRIYGYTEPLTQWTYEMFLEHVLPEDRSRVDAVFQKAVQTQSDWSFEFRIRRADGKIRWIWATGRHKRDADGAVRRVAGIAQDITERKKAEDALKERTAALEVANKDLESFSYSVSHDLRAPLRAIDGYARLILKKQGDKFDEDTTRKFNDIRLNIQMMGRLIDDLLAFSRLGRKQIAVSQIDMEELIRDVWKEQKTINPDRNMLLTVNGMPLGYGDKALIKQVCYNLLANSVKFTKFRDPAHIEAGGYTDANEVVYYVRDNGIGFDMAFYDKLFGVFQRLHNPDVFEGTGVGLATVQRIIHRHGGRVWGEGKVNEGATFYFTLPVREKL